MVPGKPLQNLGLPHPVLHDLRRCLDEVPLCVEPGESVLLDGGETEVQDVAEFVKEG